MLIRTVDTPTLPVPNMADSERSAKRAKTGPVQGEAGHLSCHVGAVAQISAGPAAADLCTLAAASLRTR